VMPASNVPAYFADGPRAGEYALMGSGLSVIRFPIPPDPVGFLIPSDVYYPQLLKVHEYELVREVLLYKYRGKFNA